MKDRIDGAALREMILSGAAAIKIQCQQINELNVFPVPDGDTGTNMSLTIGAAATELRRDPSGTAGKIAERAAGALLRGARGNSGVILSLLFRGFSRTVKELDEIDGPALAAAFSEGVSTAYRAVMKPAEGTILTVSRVSAKHAEEAARKNPSAEHVLEEAILCARAALAETIHQNPVLKKAGVIDAGGKGYIIILEGMLAALRGESVVCDEGAVPAETEASVFSEFETGEITFPYCTEIIVQREGQKDADPFRRYLDSIGDSLVLVDDEEIIKVHVHTGEPGSVLQRALEYGSLLNVKVENMREQHTQLLAQEAQADAGQDSGPKAEEPQRPYGVVAVCAGDGLEAVFQNLGVDGIVGGGQTMNPSTEDILREIDRIPAELIYVLPNNKNILMAAQQCVRLSKKRIVVLPTATVPQGVAAMLAYDPDAQEETNTEAMRTAAEHVKTAEITYAARDSEFDGASIKQGDYLALDDGALFGTGTDLTALLRRLAQSPIRQEAEFITLYSGKDVSEQEAQDVQEIFAQLCPNAEVTLLPGGQPVYYFLIAAE